MRGLIVTLVAFGAALPGLACDVPRRAVLWTVDGGPAEDAATPGAETAQACLTPGIDPRQLTALGPSDRSHWLQPWRAYRDTWPAARLRRAVGASWAGELENTSPALLVSSGITRVRLAILWEVMSFDNPTQMNAGPRADLRRLLGTLRNAGLRPLLMMYGHERAPGPVRAGEVTLTAAAPQGATRVRVDPRGVAGLVAGRSGFANITDTRASEVIFTDITPTGELTLSRPLPRALGAGRHPVTTLKYVPFHRPVTTAGTANPLFQETLNGWTAFVRAVAREAKDVMGGVDAFDLELWNILHDHSLFMDVNNYYDPPIDDGRGPAEDVITRAIVEGTIAALADPAGGLAGVNVVNGFSNTRWMDAPATAVPGLRALGRHVRVQGHRFPRDAILDQSRPLDARGIVDGHDQGGRWMDGFTPSYDAFFPELPLTALLPLDVDRRPGQIVRDLAPLDTTDVRGTLHGRRSGIATWVTSIHLTPQWAEDNGVTFTTAALHRLWARSVLRTVAAYVGLGVEAVYFYTQRADYALVNRADPMGGEALRTLRRFMQAFAGPDTLTRPREVTVDAITGCETGMQFAGDSTAPGRPPLLDREVVAVFPFQADDDRFVLAAYVMTRNVVQEPPPGRYRLSVQVAGATARAEATDPLTGESVALTVVERAGDRIVIELPLTDYPRLITLSGP